MAKKKTPAKAAKKPVKAKAKKAQKAAPKKKAVAKKAAPKKVVAKKETPVKKVAEKVAAKPAPPQLGAFPMLTQRPIAHVKPSKGASAKDERTRYSDEELKELGRYIEVEINKEKVKELSLTNKLDSVINEAEGLLNRLGISPQNRMKKSLFELYKK